MCVLSLDVYCEHRAHLCLSVVRRATDPTAVKIEIFSSPFLYTFFICVLCGLFSLF
jgi:hypothetical protein